MALNLKAHWKSLGRGKPGHRFQERYARNQRSRASRGLLPRVLRLLGAAAATAVGVVLAFIPGPAVLFFLLAGALLASDSLWIARTLDWLEVRWHRVARWAVRIWKNLPVPARITLAVLGVGLSAASTYGFYRVMN
jgi:hypothetical protein